MIMIGVDGYMAVYAYIYRRLEMMKIYRAHDYNDMSRKAANIISAQIIIKPNCVLGLATGSTPLGIYAQLVEWYKKDDLDFSRVKTFNLDEYVGLPEDNPQSYHYFMNENLFSKVNIERNNVHVPEGTNEDIEGECLSYERAIDALGGIDMQLLGLGPNGHIGFNEPGNCFTRKTHIVDLSESTIEANKRFFEDASMVPRQAITMGIGTIMKARKILMVVDGAKKAEVLMKALTGEVTPEVPASILQLHPDFTLVADDEALKYM
nr:glucosamine-6-phosphate deaminase [Butyrivibrio proteoclasticus]